MADDKLEHRLTKDTLFKVYFVKNKTMLKHLVAALLGISPSSIRRLVLKNPELAPESYTGKFCRLDISMEVDDQLVDLEVQVKNEGDFVDRSLFYLARNFSSAIDGGEDYSSLPNAVVISILDFELLSCQEFISDCMMMETKRHTLLSDKLRAIYVELPKLPKTLSSDDPLCLWAQLFNARTPADLNLLASKGGGDHEDSCQRLPPRCRLEGLQEARAGACGRPAQRGIGLAPC